MAGSSSTGSTSKTEWVTAFAAVAAVLVSSAGALVSCQVKDSQTRTAHQTDVTARYSAAAKDIGSDQRLTREAALYALKDLARDNAPNSCRESAQLLSAFLRWAGPNVKADDAAPSTTSAVSKDEVWVAAGMVAAVTSR